MKRKKKVTTPAIDPAPPAMETLKEKIDQKNDIQLRIDRSEDGQTLAIFIKAPVLAEVIRKMATGNYKKDAYPPMAKELLVDIEGSGGKNVVTRPAITKITRNFVSAVDFSFEAAPPPWLIANPDKLGEGYTILYKVDKPIPPDVIKKWGKQFMDGCSDILSNARPFRMSWVMSEVK